MKFAQILFSPTGGTRKAAEAITQAWGPEVLSFDLTCPDLPAAAFQQEDLVLIAVPSYGGRVPALARQRLERFQGGGASCVLVCVYGNRAYEDTLAELQDCAEHCGFRVLAAAAAVAEHSILRQFAAGRPDQLDRDTLRAFSLRILEKFRQGGPHPALRLPGNRPYRKPGPAGAVPKAGSRCINCGLCAAHCPAQAIPQDNGRKTKKNACISCMRCAALCPRSARAIHPALAAAAALALKKSCSLRKECELFL